MTRIIKIGLAVLVFFAIALMVVRSVPTHPVVVLQVLDTAGKSIAGAVIQPQGLRPKKINGEWTWSEDNMDVKPTPVTTDAYGIARVPYPRYVYEKTETGELTFGVDHPDYCSDRPSRVVSATPPSNAKLADWANFLFMVTTRRIVTRPDPVVLKRGGIVKVSGYIGSKQKLVPLVYAQLATQSVPRSGFWVPGSSNELINRRVAEGTNGVRLFYLPPTGRAYFSEPADFISVPGQSNEFCLELKPGLELSGRLDDLVPRPVNHGRVQVSAAAGTTNTPDKFTWSAWRNINPDGTFSFNSLPPGRVEITAICDGFKSKDGQAKVGNFCMPQVFQLTNQDVDGVVKMEPTATCEITILDGQGKPLPDASVGFWPNVLWNGRGSTIFMGWSFNSEDVYRSGEDFNWHKLSKGWPRIYAAESDQRGIATVSNLPAFNQYFDVDHTNFEMAIDSNNRREASAQLQPGQTNRVTVTLQKKGTQFLQSPR